MVVMMSIRLAGLCNRLLRDVELPGGDDMSNKC